MQKQDSYEKVPPIGNFRELKDAGVVRKKE